MLVVNGNIICRDHRRAGERAALCSAHRRLGQKGEQQVATSQLMSVTLADSGSARRGGRC